MVGIFYAFRDEPVRDVKMKCDSIWSPSFKSKPSHLIGKRGDVHKRVPDVEGEDLKSNPLWIGNILLWLKASVLLAMQC